MNQEQVKKLLEEVSNGRLAVGDAVDRLRSLPFEQLPFATIDHHRHLRCGHPEVIYCPGKTADQVVEIALRLAGEDSVILATRTSPEQCEALVKGFGESRPQIPVNVNSIARAVLIGRCEPVDAAGACCHVGVVCAGTSDLSVAEEAMVTLAAMRVPAVRLVDVGVAGLHRLLPHVQALQKCCSIVVAAGMEGALPSVVGGLVACPVFAVPTSVGYGASFGGLSALLGMLNSCSSNVTVVNIDNGFGAAFSAALVYKQIVRFC